jgi:hypothetical protein
MLSPRNQTSLRQFSHTANQRHVRQEDVKGFNGANGAGSQYGDGTNNDQEAVKQWSIELESEARIVGKVQGRVKPEVEFSEMSQRNDCGNERVARHAALSAAGPRISPTVKLFKPTTKIGQTRNGQVKSRYEERTNAGTEARQLNQRSWQLVTKAKESTYTEMQSKRGEGVHEVRTDRQLDFSRLGKDGSIADMAMLEPEVQGRLQVKNSESTVRRSEAKSLVRKAWQWIRRFLGKKVTGPTPADRSGQLRPKEPGQGSRQNEAPQNDMIHVQAEKQKQHQRVQEVTKLRASEVRDPTERIWRSNVPERTDCDGSNESAGFSLKENDWNRVLNGSEGRDPNRNQEDPADPFPQTSQIQATGMKPEREGMSSNANTEWARRVEIKALEGDPTGQTSNGGAYCGTGVFQVRKDNGVAVSQLENGRLRGNPNEHRGVQVTDVRFGNMDCYQGMVTTAAKQIREPPRTDEEDRDTHEKFATLEKRNGQVTRSNGACEECEPEPPPDVQKQGRQEDRMKLLPNDKNCESQDWIRKSPASVVNRQDQVAVKGLQSTSSSKAVVKNAMRALQ